MAGDEADVLVVGAGISGLCAARMLSESYGLKVKVLEASDRVGGRTCTIQHPEFGCVDVGGAYVGPTQNRVLRLAKEFGLQLYNVNEQERTVLSLKGTWKGFRGTVPPFWNPFALLDLNNVIRRLEYMAKKVPVHAPWLAPKAKEWDSMTVQEFINKTTWISSSRALMTLVVQSLLTCEPHEISLLHFLWYINSGQGLMRMTSVTNGAQERKFVGGSQQLSDKLAEKLPDGSVIFSSEVVKISQDKEKVTVTADSGQVFTAKYVLLGVSPTLLNKIRFNPALSGMRTQLLQRVPMGSIIKTVMFYENPFWKDLDFCGASISEDGPVGYSMDDTKPDGSHPALMGFILADKSRQLCQLSTEQRQKALSDHYAKVFRCDDFLKPVGYVEKDWMSDVYSGGCYTISLPPGALTNYGSILREPMGRVYFAGTETATFYAGYMEGAVQAGERAAREILYSMGGITCDEVWQEEPYCDDSGPVTDMRLSLIEEVLPSVGSVLLLFAAGSVTVMAYVYQRYLKNW